MEHDETIRSMTLRQKISYCTGADMWHTKAIPALGVDAIAMSDGPHGLRCQSAKADILGIDHTLPATCFPTAVTSGASWNESLLALEGEAIAREAIAAGVSVVLGPGCNIKRNPLAGRNFEYFSEDPLAAGTMAAAFIRGQQKTGVSSCLKHFAVNSQEYKRQNSDSIVDERALREIYLAPFELAIKNAQPGTVMCSYNKINGVYASDNRWLLTDVLRRDWGFSGTVISDWGALNDRIAAFHAGCDLNMPGGAVYMEKAAEAAVKSGALSESDVDACVSRILNTVAQAKKIPPQSAPVDFEAHHALSQRIAEAGAVLLKNDGILPLSLDGAMLFGHMAEETRYQGSGSSRILPKKVVNIRDAMPDLPYFACCDVLGDATDEALQTAAEQAKAARIAIVIAGLPDHYESEGFDREHMRMPEGHVRMIEAIADANPNTVVVLLGGSPMELPWADMVRAILYMGLPGQAAGDAVKRLLTGEVNPSGKLTETWPMRYEVVPSRDTFGVRDPEYRESIYVGYRYYDKANVPVRFPFGYGLSYTQFAYSDLTIDGMTVTAKITNTGSVKGAEVVQLYIAPPQDGIFRPAKELKGFARVELLPGETKTVTFTLSDRSFAVWADGWKTPKGTYTVLLAASGADVRLSETIEVDGVVLPETNVPESYRTLASLPSREDWEQLLGRPVPVRSELKKGEFTMNSSCLEMKDTSRVMRLQYRLTERLVAKGFGGKRDMNNATYRMMLTCAADAPMRALVISGGGRLKEPFVRGLLKMANGHFFKGLFEMFKRA